MNRPFIRPLFPLLFVALLGTTAGAQVITGRVVSSTGAPVAGINIDGFDTSGNEIDLLNDGTDANGDYTTTVDDVPGIYSFVFYPPAPPVTTHLVGERPNVVVVSTTALGTITLGAGVLLSGRAVRSGSIPVSNVTLVVLDGPTGQAITQVQTKTNAFGQFNLAVPTHPIELQLDATSTGLILASRSIERSPSGATALGDILLPAGATVTGHVQRTNGTAVGGVDLDFVRLSSGKSVFVPGDNTNAAGNFSVVVPLGTYDVEVCPKTADALAAKRVTNVTFSTTTVLPTVVLGAGIQLFGTVLDAHGLPAGDVDVDVMASGTGADILLCGDNTSGSGAYSVFVPSGTYDVVFTQNGVGSVIGGDLHQGVVVTAPKLLNGQLPAHSHGNASSGAPGDGGSTAPFLPGRTRGAAGHLPGSAPLLVGLSSDGRSLALDGIPAGQPGWLLVGASPAQLRPESGVLGARLLAFRAGAGPAQVELEATGGGRFLRVVALDARRGLVAGPIQVLGR